MPHERLNQSRTNKLIHERSDPTSGRSLWSTVPAHPILQLQRTIGNRAVQRLLRSRTLQAQLAISQPGDIYEQEADRVAEEVIRMPAPAVQRTCPACAAGASPCARCEPERKPLVQRRVAEDGLPNSDGSIIQRAEAAGEMIASEGGNPTREEGSRCPSWFKDPQSLSKRAAETYAQNDMTPPSTATVERIECEGPNWLGNHGCYVHFSDGLVLRVIVREKDVVVGVPPINTWTPPPATPLCFYDYHCPEGLLVLTKRECKSAKPSGPTVVAQRRAAPAGSKSIDAAPLVNNVLASPGQPLDAATREFFAARFDHDFDNVRVHADAAAAESARSINALAYTVGPHVIFGAEQYAPRSAAGKRLLAHELTHVVQQAPRTAENETGHRDTAPIALTKIVEPTISRAPTYPDATCNSVQGSITRAWPAARRWVQVAIRRLRDPSAVAGALQAHFRIDPNDSAHAGDIATVQRNFARMEQLFDTDIDNRCNRATSGSCTLPDGRIYAAFVHAGRPQDGITHCLASADVGFLSQESLVQTLVHEVAHLADSASTDYAYRGQAAITTYKRMTRGQAIHNGDSYSEFARDLFMGATTTPLLLGLTTGALLSSGRPRWAIGASFGPRSRSGIEVFDLVGGLHMFIALDIAASAQQPVRREFGMELNIGAISRSAHTRFFVDTRIGGFVTTDLALEEPTRAGVSSSTLIGWADSSFRTGVNLRLLYDFLQGNHALIIGGEFNWGP